MNKDQIKAVFDQQASHYDQNWEKSAPIRDGLLFLLKALLIRLPVDAKILSVGSGTGQELAYLAKHFSQWQFTAVEPSGAMLELCRKKAEKEGFIERCYFHEGYLETLPTGDQFDAATCLLVSQFILDQTARRDLFHQISRRLKPGGILAVSDLSAQVDTESYDATLRLWQNVMAPPNASPQDISRMKSTYDKDVAIFAPAGVAAIIQSAGFEEPVQFFQAGLIHAWFARSSA